MTATDTKRGTRRTARGTLRPQREWSLMPSRDIWDVELSGGLLRVPEGCKVIVALIRFRGQVS